MSANGAQQALDADGEDLVVLAWVAEIATVSDQVVQDTAVGARGRLGEDKIRVIPDIALDV